MAVLDILLSVGLWCAWWLLGVDWRRCWPILAAGGWIVLCGLTLLAALLWTAIDPAACNCLPNRTLPALLGHLLSIVPLVVVALFCGWLQGRFGWYPEEIVIDPPPADPDAGPGRL
jgi:hypothetical protein